MSYDLKTLKAPVLKGAALHAFTLALENPLTRSMLLPKLLDDAGFTQFRARTVDEEPSVQPPLPHASGESGPVPEALDLLPIAAGSRDQSMGDFSFATVADFASAYEAGATDPEKVAAAVLEAIQSGDALSPPMRTMIASRQDDLMEQARASAERHRNGAALGPLDGVPVAVKDETDQVPYPTTLGTSFQDTPATEDSAVVARMRAQGALLIGKANMHEIGLGVTGHNPHHGTARNPYHPGHHTGGSSSGSAAAVASGLCPIAIGADGGGSIRIPAGFCGVVGLKGTFGRVSEWGTAPLCWSVAHMGPIAATAADCALGYAVLAGPDPRYQAGLGQPPPHLSQLHNGDLSGIRIGVYRPWFEDAQAPLVAACQETLERFQAAGAEIIDIEIPDLELGRLAHTVSIGSEMATAREEGWDQHRKDYGLDVRVNLTIARTFSASDYVRAQQARTRMSHIFGDVLRNVDVVATPTTGITAPLIPEDALPAGQSDLETLSIIMRFAFPANLCGLPAIAFPVGYDPQGLPISFQAMGGPWQEHTLLRLAVSAEQWLERRKPAVHFELLP